jgi:indole-3-glycerol phosphate synthase
MTTTNLHINRDIIIANKRHQLQKHQAKLPMAAVLALAESQEHALPLLSEVDDSNTVTLIGQVNRTRIYDPVATAISLVKAGADAVSLFTDHLIYDQDFDDLLLMARAVRTTPVLYQNYSLNAYSVLCARGSAASSIMLHASLMSEADLRSAVTNAQRCGMSVFIQAKTQNELLFALSLSPHVVCIGDEVSHTIERALRTLDELRPLIPSYTKVMLAQALETLRDVELAVIAGVKAVIVSAELVRIESERLRAITHFNVTE